MAEKKKVAPPKAAVTKAAPKAPPEKKCPIPKQKPFAPNKVPTIRPVEPKPEPAKPEVPKAPEVPKPKHKGALTRTEAYIEKLEACKEPLTPHGKSVLTLCKMGGTICDPFMCKTVGSVFIKFLTKGGAKTIYLEVRKDGTVNGKSLSSTVERMKAELAAKFEGVNVNSGKRLYVNEAGKVVDAKT